MTLLNRIIYTRANDGGVSIVSPAPKEVLERQFGSMTDSQYEEHVWSRSIPDDALDPMYILDTDLPENREFRDAWIQRDSKIIEDFSRAKEIYLTNLRRDRNKALEVLDIETLRGNDVQDQKQVLRDITKHQLIQDAATVEDLKVLTLDYLLKI